MRIQPIGKAFKLTLFVYPDGLSPRALGDRVWRTAFRLRRSLGAEPDPEEQSRRALIWQSDLSGGDARRSGESVSNPCAGRGRNFSPWDKQRIFLRSGGQCASCYGELRSDWEADHIMPHSRGGQTVLENAQALCATCNRRKRDRLPGDE